MSVPNLKKNTVKQRSTPVSCSLVKQELEQHVPLTSSQRTLSLQIPFKQPDSVYKVNSGDSEGVLRELIPCCDAFSVG